MDRRVVHGIVVATILVSGGCGGSSGGNDSAPRDDGAASGSGSGTAPDDPAADGGSSDGASDCAVRVPCAWTSADGTLSIVLSAAQGERSDGSGKLRVDFGVATTRGGELELLTSSTALAGEAALDAGLVALGDARSNFSDRVSASLEPTSGDAAVPASVEFLTAAPEGAALLERLALELVDGGQPRQAVFENVPLGDPDANAVDCALALPCAWTTADGGVAVTLTASDVRAIDGRATPAVDYRVEATRPLSVATDGYTRATTASGTVLSPSLIALGDEESRFGAPLEATLAAGEGVDGTVGFDTPSEPVDGAFETLRLNLREARLPREPWWNPLFRNVPLGR